MKETCRRCNDEVPEDQILCSDCKEDMRDAMIDARYPQPLDPE